MSFSRNLAMSIKKPLLYARGFSNISYRPWNICSISSYILSVWIDQEDLLLKLPAIITNILFNVSKMIKNVCSLADMSSLLYQLVYYLYFSSSMLSLLRSAGKCHVWRNNNTSKKQDINEEWEENQSLNIKTAVERPILKLGLPNFRWSFYFILLLVSSLLFRRFFYDVTLDTF